LHNQGTGRHSRDEIYAIGCRDLTAIADLLSDQPYFLGAEPSSVDATAYAFLANVLWAPIDSPLRAHAAKLPNAGSVLSAHEGALSSDSLFDYACTHIKRAYVFPQQRHFIQ
jgi:hypothetical protein